MLINSRRVLVTAMTLAALAACTPKAATDKAVASTPTATNTKDEVAATVNGTPIYKKDVDMILKQQRNMPDTPESRKAAIDNIALQLLVAQEAVKKGLDKSPETMDEMEMARQAVLAQAFVQDYLKSHQITDAQVTIEYDKLKAQASGNEYKARHILVKTEEEANAIIGKLKKNMKAFGALAKSESMDPGSKNTGGDLGWFDGHSMVKEFSEAVAKMEKGKISETPVKSQFGYHVILLEDTRPSTAAIPSMEQVKAGLTQKLQQENLKTLLDEMKQKAKIDIVAAAPVAAKPEVAPAAPETEKK